jgi:hypothetical protein
VKKSREAECISCGRVREVDGAGLCHTQCKGRVQRRKGDPDVDYFVWLLGVRDARKIVIPRALLLPLIERGVGVFGSLTDLAEASGVSARRLSAVRAGSNGSYHMGCSLARALDCLNEFELEACQVGRADWSDVGTYCGDGSGLLGGCGTYFHEHYADGLCEECWFREVLGQGASEPRDVRVAAMRGRVND